MIIFTFLSGLLGSFSIIGVLTSILAFVGLGGLGLFGMSLMGFGTGIVAWFVAKKIPWKLIVICALALLISLTVFSGYRTFRNNQVQLIQTKVELDRAKEERDAQKARADNYVTEHDAQVKRIDELEKERSTIEEHTSTLQAEIDDMHLEQDFTNEPSKAVAALNARNGALSKLLHNASRGRRNDPSRHAPAGGSSAGATSSAHPVH